MMLLKHNIYNSIALKFYAFPKAHKHWEKLTPFTKLKENDIQLALFFSKNTYFCYNNEFFKQIFGTPMG